MLLVVEVAVVDGVAFDGVVPFMFDIPVVLLVVAVLPVLRSVVDVVDEVIVPFVFSVVVVVLWCRSDAQPDSATANAAAATSGSLCVPFMIF